MIQWEEEKDLHIRGSSEFGQLWIRLNRQRIPTGIYTMFGKTRKFVPGENDTIEDSKVIAEIAVENEKYLREVLP